MLDSLVRVSRRVGWLADTDATDLQCLGKKARHCESRGDESCRQETSVHSTHIPSQMRQADTVYTRSSQPNSLGSRDTGTEVPAGNKPVFCWCNNRSWRSSTENAFTERINVSQSRLAIAHWTHYTNGKLNPVDCKQLHPFTSKRFHALLTLSSKFFATFPHGTCLLSVSW
jgi:hypothetical protein